MMTTDASAAHPNSEACSCADHEATSRRRPFRSAQAARVLRARWSLSLLLLGVLPALGLASSTPVSVLTYHNDNGRTGLNPGEKILTPENVVSTSFGKLFSYPVDGYYYTQPLYVPGVAVPGKGTHNVVYVATTHDSVYAFDADSNQGDNAGPLWQVSFINPDAGITAMTVKDLGLTDPSGTESELGIVGTPVIDSETGTLFVVAKIKDSRRAVPVFSHLLYALDLGSGAVKFGGPVPLQATVRGTGLGTDGLGNIAFNNLYQLQRPGLLLVNGTVYVGFASAGDLGPYHGWLLGYDARTLRQVAVYNDTPNGEEGGIWMSGGAPAADEAGAIYFITGNGTFDANSGGPDLGDSFVKLQRSGTSLAVADWFTPYNQAVLNANDGDLGSGAAMLLPDSAGSPEHPRLLVGCGKEGIVYLLDCDNMGHFNPTDNSHAVQWFGLGAPTLSMPACFNNRIYYQGINDTLKFYNVSNAFVAPSPASHSGVTFSFPGATPSLSANDHTQGIAWVIQADAFGTNGPAVLRAFDADDLSRQLYTSSDAGVRDRLGPAQKFTPPTIANGKVYAGSGFQLAVFGTLGGPVIATQPQDRTVDTGASVTFNVGAGGTPPFTYQWRFKGDEIAGATNAWLTVTNVQPANAGDYSVVVSNAYDPAVSEAAFLVVNPTAVRPRLSINARFEITLSGELGRTYEIQYLSDLDPDQSDWVILTTVDLTNAVQVVTDPQGTNATQRFYRAFLQPF